MHSLFNAARRWLLIPLLSGALLVVVVPAPAAGPSAMGQAQRAWGLSHAPDSVTAEPPAGGSTGRKIF